MRILHILSQFEITGAEVYAATLSDAQKAAGHEVLIVSPYWHTKMNTRYLSVKNIGQAAMGKRFAAVFQIRKIIKELKVDVVHTHSRASSWAAHFATKGLGVAYVSTIHGRQHLHKRKHLNVYGENIIAVCDNLKKHLIQEVKIAPDAITVIGNGMHLPNFEQVKLAPLPFSSDSIVLSIPGRTSGPKGERTGNLLANVFPSLMEKYPKLSLLIVGDEFKKLSIEHQKAWQSLLQKYPERVHWEGFVNNLDAYLAASDIVIGSGRVAIEALLLEKLCISFGESTFEGLVIESSFTNALASNFGDISSSQNTPAYNWQKIQEEVEKVVTLAENGKNKPSEKPNFLKTINLETRKHFSLPLVSKAIQEHYLKAIEKLKK